MEYDANTTASAKICFVEGELTLIHIPLNQYENYVINILKLLFPIPHDEKLNLISDPSREGKQHGWANRLAFCNISVTPIECSVICPKHIAEAIFAPKIAQSEVAGNDAMIVGGDFIAISIVGQGTEAAKRVQELTMPLSLAGISLFFITTYFSDYILVPSKARSKVVHALERRGYVFEKSSEAYVNTSYHHRHQSSTSSTGSGPPATPPPTTLSELQSRLAALLEQRSILPRVDRETHLVHCASHSGDSVGSNADEGFQLGLMKCLIHRPSFLSLTLTKDEAASILLEKSLVTNFNSNSNDVLLGNTSTHLIPITLDLQSLPFDATGVVCGVAGRLAGDSQVLPAIEMSYLSTAKAGTVMIEEADLDAAMNALRIGEDGTLRP